MVPDAVVRPALAVRENLIKYIVLEKAFYIINE
jgi:hypothetical protein